MANHVDVCCDELKASKALQYFNTGVNACVLPAARPKGGEVYLFSPGDDDVKKGQYYNNHLCIRFLFIQTYMYDCYLVCLFLI